MKTRVLKIDPDAVRPGAIREIARILAADGVIVYPTDTFYGLGSNCLSQTALRRIFEIKERPGSKGLPVLISDLEMIERLAAGLPPVFEALTTRFWPGPLTLVLRAASDLPPELVGPERTIGVRLPAVPWLLALIRSTGVPLVATSANLSGHGEMGLAGDVKRLFEGKVDLVVDGGRTRGGKPSTVIDLTGEEPALIREGILSKRDLKEFLSTGR